MVTFDSQILPLLQLADSALPTGGYAFSAGLEAAARLGLLASADDLLAHLRHVMHQTAWAELPWLNACWRLDPLAPCDPLLGLFEELNALLYIPSVNRASGIQGRGWLSILEVLYPAAGLPALRAWLAEHDLTPHYVLCLGYGLRRAGMSIDDSRRLYCYLSARDQVSAAVRLGLVGPVEGQRLLAEMLSGAESLLKETRDLMPEQARRAAPLLELAQANHDSLYTRLFQS